MSDLLPRVKEAKHLVDLLNRVTMQFEVVLEKGSENVPRVKISVVNTNPNLSILIEPQEFLPKLRCLSSLLDAILLHASPLVAIVVNLSAQYCCN